MLQLKNITKIYQIGDIETVALKDVSLSFRKTEFVAILGPSGCGKTTMLNIIGGLDRYNSGDLIINNKSTKLYEDPDWDAYRNHSIGFVFQSYNLIPHQNVLSNVELALTLSGVSKSERRKRAIDALTRVGLGDQLYKKPNQMSGGQMQRVAIARALVNNPDILLADEPTGALDTETSRQIMEILKEISKEKLVIMVTHNPELAKAYATRTIKLLDGRVISDSDPFIVEDKVIDTPLTKAQKRALKKERKKNKTSMSFFTALSLSLNNLMTKKTRTILTSFAGSIGIIGIALIMSVSNGFQAYIDRTQEDMLSSTPITIRKEDSDFNSVMESMMKRNSEKEGKERDLDKIYSNDSLKKMSEMVELLKSKIKQNDLESFKKYLDDDKNGFGELVNDIQYVYDIPLNIYTSNGKLQVNPSTIVNEYISYVMGGNANPMFDASSIFKVWSEMIDNPTLLKAQYDLVYGDWPSTNPDVAKNQIVLVVDKNNEISDIALYSLGIKDPEEFKAIMAALKKYETIELPESKSYTFKELVSNKFKLVLNTDFFEKDENGIWKDIRKDDNFDIEKLVNEKGIELEIVGILRPAEDSIVGSINGTIGYTKALSDYIISHINDSEIVKEQKANPNINVFSGQPFSNSGGEITIDMIMAYIETLPADQQAMIKAFIQGKTEAEIIEMFKNVFSNVPTSYEESLKYIGYADLSKPTAINIYPKDFASKDKIADKIKEYNKKMTADGKEEKTIEYTDFYALFMSSVSKIISIISYVLIAFVSISLVVSSIMIGIITYISVLERTKEIGILRSIGASKNDISRVFNAETLIIGFGAGMMGILVTLLLTIPINIILKHFTGISTIAALPLLGSIVLVLISMGLTLVAGLIPSKIAAKKDPVVALRTE